MIDKCRIYIVNTKLCNEMIDDNCYETAYEKLHEKKEEKKNINSIKESILGEMAVRLVLQKDYGIERAIILKDMYGKPYLRDIPLYFNYSHTQNYISLVIASDPVGIDIEWNDNCKYMDIAQYFFSEQEYNMIINTKDRLRTKLFYNFWTAKESLGKCLGVGLTREILQLDPVYNSKGKKIYIVKEEKFYVYTKIIKYNYTLSFAIKGGVKEIEKSEIKPNCIEKFLKKL